MAEDLNRIIVIGRLTREHELFYSASGYPHSTFTIASNKSIKKNDQWEDYTSFFEISLWGKVAESLNDYIKKGQQVAIEGHLKQERWTDKESKSGRSKIVIEAKKIQLLGSKNKIESNEIPESEFDDNPF